MLLIRCWSFVNDYFFSRSFSSIKETHCLYSIKFHNLLILHTHTLCVCVPFVLMKHNFFLNSGILCLCICLCVCLSVCMFICLLLCLVLLFLFFVLFAQTVSFSDIFQWEISPMQPWRSSYLNFEKNCWQVVEKQCVCHFESLLNSCTFSSSASSSSHSDVLFLHLLTVSFGLFLCFYFNI